MSDSKVSIRAPGETCGICCVMIMFSSFDRTPACDRPIAYFKIPADVHGWTVLAKRWLPPILKLKRAKWALDQTIMRLMCGLL